jgi:cytochrome c peroxidase
MSHGVRAAAWGLAAALAGCARPSPAEQRIDGFTPRELRIIFTLSPLPDPPPDPTNAVGDNPAAARLGQFFFFDRGLSAGNRVSCASCHDPAKGWTDGRSVPSDGLRHVPSLFNVAYERWLFWDGRADSLFSQALQPIEQPREMGGSRGEVARRIRENPELAAAYREVFGPLPEESVGSTDRIFSNVGKAIGAFERKLISRNSPFDAYVAALRSGNPIGRGAYPEAGRRGLKLFVGRANCVLCHNGPTFSDKEFHDLGLPDDLPPGREDTGRFGGIEQLLRDPFNATGRFSDAPNGGRGLPTAFLVNSDRFKGAFKTAGLRNVAITSPYFHRGQFRSLEQVVQFYSTLEDPRPGPKAPAGAPPRGHGSLVPLNLTGSEIANLVAFLKTLTGAGLHPELTHAPASPLLTAR